MGVIGPTAVVASSTESPHKDIFIAIPTGAGISNASLQGTCNVGFIDFLQGNPSLVRDGYFTLSTSGDGSFGNVSVAGAMANQGSKNTTQVLSGVAYDITGSSGSGTITFPTAAASVSALVSGEKTFYFSADGNIILGGNPDGFDIMLGVFALSAPATNSIYQGIYYTAGLENNAIDAGKGINGVDAFSGSVFSLGQGTTISHLRLVTFNSTAIDYTYEPTPYNLSSSGTFHDGFLRGMLGVGGQAFVEVGTDTYYSLTAGFSAGQYSGSTGASRSSEDLERRKLCADYEFRRAGRIRLAVRHGLSLHYGASTALTAPHHIGQRPGDRQWRAGAHRLREPESDQRVGSLLDALTKLCRVSAEQ